MSRQNGRCSPPTPNMPRTPGCSKRQTTTTIISWPAAARSSPQPRRRLKIGVSCGYGFPLSPYSATAYLSSDELVDTANASFGATCAPPNRPFGAFYKQAKAVPGGGSYRYVSPDRMIDASTCVLPDYTWFNKDQPHYTELRMDDWVEWFTNAPRGEDSVHASARHPQWKHFVRFFVFEPTNCNDSVWSKIMDTLLAAIIWVMDIWRRLLLLPLFWM